MAVAAVCVLALAAATGVRLDYRRAELPRLAGYGLITALHFFFYIWSLEFTTIAHSLALIYTAPLFVTLFAALLLREPIDRRKYLGIPVVLLGVAVLAGLEPRLDARMALRRPARDRLGDLLRPLLGGRPARARPPAAAPLRRRRLRRGRDLAAADRAADLHRRPRSRPGRRDRRARRLPARRSATRSTTPRCDGSTRPTST